MAINMRRYFVRGKSGGIKVNGDGWKVVGLLDEK